MELKEFMGVFRPLRRDINFYGETVGDVPVQLAAPIEVEVSKFVSSMKKKLGRKKNKIQHFHVPENIMDDFKILMRNLPKNILLH